MTKNRERKRDREMERKKGKRENLERKIENEVWLLVLFLKKESVNGNNVLLTYKA